MRTDTLFYRLFQDRPALLFELAGWDCPEDAAYGWRAEEVKETAFRLDGVLMPAGSRSEPPVFVEVQFQPDAGFYARWFSEIFLYLYRLRLRRSWRAVVLYPSADVDTGSTAAYRPLLDSAWVRRIYLDQVLAENPEPGPGLGLVGLILCEPGESAGKARTLYRSAGAQREWILDWVETILVYKLPKLSREEIKMVLELQDVDLKRSRFYQEVFAEGRDEGREEGLEEGREEGVSEGRRSEARQLVVRLLRRRFGSLAPDLEASLSRLPLGRLELLAEDLLGFESIRDLERWLGG